MGLAAQFRVKEGKHSIRDVNGKLKQYHKGQIVKSTSDLIEQFPGKFEKVHKDEEEQDDHGGGVARAMKLREKMQEQETRDHQEEDTAEEETAEEESPPVPDRDFGSEVTKKFEALAAKGLQVFYDGDNYTVLKDDKVLVLELEDKRSVLDWFKTWKGSPKKK